MNFGDETVQSFRHPSTEEPLGRIRLLNMNFDEERGGNLQLNISYNYNDNLHECMKCAFVEFSTG